MPCQSTTTNACRTRLKKRGRRCGEGALPLRGVAPSQPKKHVGSPSQCEPELSAPLSAHALAHLRTRPACVSRCNSRRTRCALSCPRPGAASLIQLYLLSLMYTARLDGCHPRHPLPRPSPSPRASIAWDGGQAGASFRPCVSKGHLPRGALSAHRLSARTFAHAASPPLAPALRPENAAPPPMILVDRHVVRGVLLLPEEPNLHRLRMPRSDRHRMRGWTATHRVPPDVPERAGVADRAPIAVIARKPLLVLQLLRNGPGLRAALGNGLLEGRELLDRRLLRPARQQVLREHPARPQAPVVQHPVRHRHPVELHHQPSVLGRLDQDQQSLRRLHRRALPPVVCQRARVPAVSTRIPGGRLCMSRATASAQPNGEVRSTQMRMLEWGGRRRTKEEHEAVDGLGVDALERKVVVARR
eukprot:1217378-Rhodomonas_salina.1